MEEFLAAPFFRYLIFPIGSAILGIAIKYATRNDQYSSFSKEDIAIGLELMRTACLMLILLISEKAVSLSNINKKVTEILTVTPKDTNTIIDLQKQAQIFSSELISSSLLIGFMIFSLWCISTIVRKWGWKSPTEMHPFTGIALPLVFGVLALVVVVAGGTK